MKKKVCEGCENNGKLICKQCGCFISKKVYSRTVNPCPLEKWGERHIKSSHSVWTDERYEQAKQVNFENVNVDRWWFHPEECLSFVRHTDLFK